jgi:hypothetical protein
MKIKWAVIRLRGQIVATGLSHEDAKLAVGGSERTPAHDLEICCWLERELANASLTMSCLPSFSVS